MHRILIADDDRELCTLLADYLRREGFEVEAVHDGAAALARLYDAQRRPDLLILDVMMPGRDGLETLRELRLQQRLASRWIAGSAWNWAPTTISPSPACRANCWRACARNCDVRCSRRPRT